MWRNARKGFKEKVLSFPPSTLPFRKGFSGLGSNWVAFIGTQKMAEDVTRARPLSLPVEGRPSPEMLGHVSTRFPQTQT